MTTRVLVPYLMTHFAGVRRVLATGLPLLARAPGVALTYAELCGNAGDMDAMAASGVRVERRIGVPGPSTLSTRHGVGRLVDLGRGLPRLTRIAARMADRLAEHDVVYVHGHRELVVAIAARRLARLARPPALVWHWHGAPLTVEADASRSAAARLFTRRVATSCARVIAISDFAAGEARALGVPPDRVVVVLNAASVEGGGEAATLPPRSPGQIVLLVACAVVRRHKGVHVAIEALRHLPERYVLWVTGEDRDPIAVRYVRELEALAARLGVGSRVRLVGPRRDVHRVMQAADVVLVPSVWDEPFGLVAAEAQLLGVPVVASDRGALPELMGHGRLGLVAPGGDAAALAACVERLGGDPALRERLSAAGRDRAAARYGYARWTREVASALRDAAGVAPPLEPSEAAAG